MKWETVSLDELSLSSINRVIERAIGFGPK